MKHKINEGRHRVLTEAKTNQQIIEKHVIAVIVYDCRASHEVRGTVAANDKHIIFLD